MGLASMRDRAERHRGWWRITSTPGVGTTAEFWIPPVEVEEAEPRATDAAINGPVGSTVGNNGSTESGKSQDEHPTDHGP